MKKNFYLQHSLTASYDSRMDNLIEKEGMKGYGAYWYIMERLELLPEPRASLKYLESFSKNQIKSLNYFRKIVLEYGLFIIYEDGYFKADELNPSQESIPKPSKSIKKTAKNIGKLTKNDVKTTKNDAKPAKNGAKTAKNDAKSAKNDAKSTENEQKSAGNLQKLSKNDAEESSKKSCKSLKTSSLQECREEYKENIKDIIITTTTEKEKEKNPAADDDADKSDIRSPQKPPQPIHHWEELVDGLSQDSGWVDIACMKSGYGMLMKTYFKEAVNFFKQHIRSYDKGSELLDMKEIHRYFVNFTSPGSRTSKQLHEHLEALNRQCRAKWPDPYRFEQRLDGQRIYQGCPIPDDAPPRPDETAIWNATECIWISKKR